MLKKIFLIFISFGFISKVPKNNNITNKPVTDLVKNFYNLLDEGKYNDLSLNVIEGKWSSEKNLKGKNYHSCTGILNVNEITEKNTREFGEGGWALRILTLNILSVTDMPREDFRNNFQREYEVLEKAGLLNDINNFFQVKVSGSRAGACGVGNWNRNLIVVSCKDSLKVVITGVPKYLNFQYRDQFFFNLDF